MLKSKTLLMFLYLLMASNQSVFAKQKLDPPLVPNELSQEQVDDLQRSWRRDGMPTVELVLGQVQDGQPVMQNTPIERKLRAAILKELGRGIDGSQLVDRTSLRTQQLRNRNALGVDLGIDASTALQQIMVDGFESGMIMMVRLMPKGEDRYAITMETIDPASAGVLASQPFLDISGNADAFIVNTYAASIAGHFVKQYSNRMLSENGPLYTMRFTIVGLEDARQARSLTRALRRIDGVPENTRIEHSFERVRAGMQVATYTVPTTQIDTGFLQDDLHDAIEEMMPNHAFVASRAGRGSMIGAVYPLQEPRWWQATNLRDAQQIRASAEKREQVKGLNRRLGVAVVVGPDIEASASVVEDPSIKLENTFDEAALQGELQTMLTQVGFDAVHDVALKDAKELAQRKMSRFENMLNLEYAAEDKKNFEYLLYGNLSEGEGVTRYEFRLIDRQTGAVVGTQRWPDSRYYSAPPKYRDDPDELRAMSRYVTGQLMSQLDARLIDDRVVMEVVVKNVEDVVDIAALAELFKDDVNVISVGTFNYSMPIGGFEIVYRGSSDSLMETLRAELPELETPMVVDVLDDRQIVVNLRRDPRLQPEVDNAARRIVPDHSAPPQPEKSPRQDQEQPKDIPVQHVSPSMLQQHLLSARDSVCVPGVRLADGTFISVGTAWTVGPNLLATNAHVVEGIEKYLAEHKNSKAIAYRSDGLEVILELGEMQVHPGYRSWAKMQRRMKSSNFIPSFDVALIKVISGDAGTPLKLATSDQMESVTIGDSVGYVGFPTEGKSKVRSRPNMMMDMSTVSAYTDIFFQRRMPGADSLIHTTLKIVGGASGSPVLHANGTVVALNSAGDMYQPREYKPISKYVRIVVTQDNEPVVTPDRQIMVAMLREPGKPIKKSSGTVLIHMQNGQQRALIEDQEALANLPPREIAYDETGVVHGTYEVKARINVAFSYAQSVEMLKELLDGTASQKQKLRERAWEARAAELNILR